MKNDIASLKEYLTWLIGIEKISRYLKEILSIAKTQKKLELEAKHYLEPIIDNAYACYIKGIEKARTKIQSLREYYEYDDWVKDQLDIALGTLNRHFLNACLISLDNSLLPKEKQGKRDQFCQI